MANLMETLTRPFQRSASDDVLAAAEQRIAALGAQFAAKDSAYSEKMTDLGRQLAELQRGRAAADRDVVACAHALEEAETQALLGEEADVAGRAKALAAARKKLEESDKRVRLIQNAQRLQAESRAKALAPVVQQLHAELWETVSQPVVAQLAGMVRQVAAANAVLAAASNLEDSMVSRVRDQNVPLHLTHNRTLPRFGTVSSTSGRLQFNPLDAGDAEMFIREAREAGFAIPED